MGIRVRGGVPIHLPPGGPSSISRRPLYFPADPSFISRRALPLFPGGPSGVGRAPRGSGGGRAGPSHIDKSFVDSLCVLDEHVSVLRKRKKQYRHVLPIVFLTSQTTYPA